MLIDRALDEMTKKNRVVVGFDLGNDFSQISYCRQNQSMPDTVSLVMGEEQYNIPTLLCRKNDVEGDAAWLIGNEALNAAKEGQGVVISWSWQKIMPVSGSGRIPCTRRKCPRSICSGCLSGKRLLSCRRILCQKILPRWHLP